ncbi:hypothetical protein CAEBREN_10521 [Caenorhabditis brenneri]|uniref:Uncharacterized protein n=1 Tax=Caenorhabditis brenneri TaxID=135651 RepID=G0N8E4_CAEBE|nr:hypothetical protein CAEBREN_10521 [Caenorhabditis brenneri]
MDSCGFLNNFQHFFQFQPTFWSFQIASD